MHTRRVAPHLALLVALVGCGTTATDTRPEWLLQFIARQEAEPVANPPAFIARREYAAGVYYFLPSRCCDVFSDLYDSEGALVCHPDGGITGNGSGDCPDLGAVIREEIVWRDTRTP
ncbi:MAG: hypothetical protein ABL963_03490 [Longimicrobiales bacterium]